MSGTVILIAIAAYFILLIIVSRVTSRGATSDSFYLGNRQSPWYVVAFGMIGASLSGVTFISVPGWVESSQFSYMQMVLGYVAGYAAIAFILLPIYYKLQLTSIYTYLEQRLGKWSYKTGAVYFLISRIIGASFRLYLVALVLEEFVFKSLGIDIPFIVTVFLTIGLIWLYTNRGGIKTIIWTDTLQTVFMLLAVVVAILGIGAAMDLSMGGIVDLVSSSENSKWFFFDDFAGNKNHFIKKFLAGAFIAVTMTGLDQDMMQKNLSCRNLKDAQKNILWLSVILVFVNLLFLSMGVVLHEYAGETGIEASGDKLFPAVALEGGLGLSIGLFFILGLIASAYSSADSALTALTTSFSVDLLNAQKMSEDKEKRVRRRVHIGMSLALLVVIMLFKAIDNQHVIAALFTAAGYTYGPLLGLYSFGLFTKRPVKDKLVPVVCILSPVICYVVNLNAEEWFGWSFGFELLLVNGALTFVGLLLIGERRDRAN
jgi:Na+/proline symporter